MKNRIPNIFFLKKEENDINEEDVWDEITLCIDCMKKNCICDISNCFCHLSLDLCQWPSKTCPCNICGELFVNCKCLIKIKKES